jgi:tetratricopeptide (TPR) repeat protein
MFYNDQQPDKIFYQGLAWRRLGQEERAASIFNNLIRYAQEHEQDEVVLDYFAVSLPNLLIFDDDLKLRNQLHCYYMAGLGHLGLNDLNTATTFLQKVLEKDAMHLGAKTHLELLQAEYSGTNLLNG